MVGFLFWVFLIWYLCVTYSSKGKLNWLYLQTWNQDYVTGKRNVKQFAIQKVYMKFFVLVCNSLIVYLHDMNESEIACVWCKFWVTLCLCRIDTDETATSLLSHHQDAIYEEANGVAKGNRSAAESSAPQVSGASASSSKSPNSVCSCA